MLGWRSAVMLAPMNQPASSKETERKTCYRSYLLRLWCARQTDPRCWQASLDDPHTGERIGFASLEELFVFLVEQVTADA